MNVWTYIYIWITDYIYLGPKLIHATGALVPYSRTEVIPHMHEVLAVKGMTEPGAAPSARDPFGQCVNDGTHINS